MKEKKDRVDDALHATRAAVEEGIVPGGGVALLRARAGLSSLKGANAEQDAGIQIVLRALEAPLRVIASNAGDEPSVVIAKVLEGKGNFGYDAASGEYGDLVETGVVDPTKVTRTALQNAGIDRGPDPDHGRHRRRSAERRKAGARDPRLKWTIDRRSGPVFRDGWPGRGACSAARLPPAFDTASLCRADTIWWDTGRSPPKKSRS